MTDLNYVHKIKKLLLNLLLYITQKLFMNMGGEVFIKKDGSKIELRSPNGRSFHTVNKSERDIPGRDWFRSHGLDIKKDTYKENR